MEVVTDSMETILSVISAFEKYVEKLEAEGNSVKKCKGYRRYLKTAYEIVDDMNKGGHITKVGTRNYIHVVKGKVLKLGLM